MLPPRPLALCTALLIILAGCRSDPSDAVYVARVGDQYLTQEELTQTLEGLHMGHDTTEAREQIIEQWITNALLYREADRLNLANDPGVQTLLREQERSVLVNELTARLYDEIDPSVSDDEIQSYYDQHREQLRLREPFAHVRYLTTETLEEAQTVLADIRAVRGSNEADSTWGALIQSYATNPDQARNLARNYYPENQIFGTTPTLRTQLERLAPGALAPILEIDSLFHVVQLVDRAEAGEIPERAWVEDEIRRHLKVRARKQMYAREVQRLRNEALAREELEIR